MKKLLHQNNLLTENKGSCWSAKSFNSKALESLNLLSGKFTAVTLLFLFLLAGIGNPMTAFGQNAAGDLDQAHNGAAGLLTGTVTWDNGNANSGNSHYLESHSMAYRLILTNLSPGSHTVDIEWDTRDNSKPAFDFITSYQALEPHAQFGHPAEVINPLLGLNLPGASVVTESIPVPTQNITALGNPQPSTSFGPFGAASRQMTMFNGTSIDDMDYLVEGVLTGASAKTSMRITFTTANATVVLAWGAHIAAQADWGPGNSAVDISGSPYHTRFLALDGSGGNQDRSMAASAVIQPPQCDVTGDNSICQNAENQVYNAVTNVTSPTYFWDFKSNNTGASIVNGANTGASVTVDPGSGSGTYEIQVTITKSNVSSTCSELVTVYPTPDVYAGADMVINCNSPMAGIELAGTSSTGGATYSWLASNGGNIVSNGNTLTPTVDAAGTYTLTVTANGCSASDAVDVTEDFNAPIADAGSDAVINCLSDPAGEATLTASYTTSPPGQSLTVSYLWSTVDGTFKAGADLTAASVAVVDAGTYTVRITNTATGCYDEDEVIVTEDFSAPIADAGTDAVINCLSDPAGEATLTGSYTTDPLGQSLTVSYLWSTVDGTFKAGADLTAASVTVVDAGTYTLRITNTATGCYDEDEVIVTEDFSAPIADAGTDAVINCLSDPAGEATLTASYTTNPPGQTLTVSYLWSTVNGTFKAGADLTAASVAVTDAGTYTVRITNTATGCYDEDEVIVTEDLLDPDVDAGPDKILSCSATEVNLEGSSITPLATYLWVASNGGVIFSGEMTLTPLVKVPGTYTLTVTGPNGCTDSDEAVVTQELNAPIADAGSDVVIDCLSDPAGEATLTGSYTTNPPGQTLTVSYLWSTLDGTFKTGADLTLASVAVTDAGTYTLRVTNTATGCFDEDEVIVTEDFSAPIADAGTDAVINCLSDPAGEATLTASYTTNPPGQTLTVSYLWSTADGTFKAGADLTAASVTVVDAGTYTVRITNTVTGCFDEDEVIVTEDFNAPIADAGTDVEINCLSNPAGEATLNGSYTTNPPGQSLTVSYLWSTTDGTFKAGADLTAASVTVVDAGTYTLRVTNTANGCYDEDEVVVTEDIDDPNVDAGGPYNIACGQTNIQLNGLSTDGVSFEWEIVSGSVQFSSTSILNPILTLNSVSATVRLTVIGANGCEATEDVNITKQVCGDRHCTLTQGGYGNANGSFCGGPRRLALINSLLAQGNLVIGSNGRTITYGAGQGSCIIKNLPAGGTADVFPAGLGNIIVNADCNNLPKTGVNAVLTKQDRFNNVLIGQTITLGLNLRLDNTLGGVVMTNVMTTYKALSCTSDDVDPSDLTGMSRIIPMSVINKLNADYGSATIANLFLLANRVLGGETGLPSPADINAAVSAINEVFDECRILSQATNGTARVSSAAGPAVSGAHERSLKAYPNPFSEVTTIEFSMAENLAYSLDVYDVTGRKVATLGAGTAEAGKVYTYKIGDYRMPEGMYMVKLNTGEYVETLKIILKR